MEASDALTLDVLRVLEKMGAADWKPVEFRQLRRDLQRPEPDLLLETLAALSEKGWAKYRRETGGKAQPVAFPHPWIDRNAFFYGGPFQVQITGEGRAHLKRLTKPPEPPPPPPPPPKPKVWIATPRVEPVAAEAGPEPAGSAEGGAQPPAAPDTGPTAATQLISELTGAAGVVVLAAPEAEVHELAGAKSADEILAGLKERIASGKLQVSQPA